MSCLGQRWSKEISYLEKVNQLENNRASSSRRTAAYSNTKGYTHSVISLRFSQSWKIVFSTASIRNISRLKPNSDGKWLLESEKGQNFKKWFRLPQKTSGLSEKLKNSFEFFSWGCSSIGKVNKVLRCRDVTWTNEFTEIVEKWLDFFSQKEIKSTSISHGSSQNQHSTLCN